MCEYNDKINNDNVEEMINNMINGNMSDDYINLKATTRYLNYLMNDVKRYCTDTAPGMMDCVKKLLYTCELCKTYSNKLGVPIPKAVEHANELKNLGFFSDEALIEISNKINDNVTDTLLIKLQVDNEIELNRELFILMSDYVKSRGIILSEAMNRNYTDKTYNVIDKIDSRIKKIEELMKICQNKTTDAIFILALTKRLVFSVNAVRRR